MESVCEGERAEREGGGGGPKGTEGGGALPRPPALLFQNVTLGKMFSQSGGGGGSGLEFLCMKEARAKKGGSVWVSKSLIDSGVWGRERGREYLRSVWEAVSKAGIREDL